MARSIVFAAFALVALAGCSQSASISPASDVPSGDWNQHDGSLSIAVGETVHVLVYGDKTGYDTEPFACDGTPTLVADDSSMVAVTTAPRERLTWNSYDGPVDAFAITGLRVGDVQLRGSCSGEATTQTVHIHP